MLGYSSWLLWKGALGLLFFHICGCRAGLLRTSLSVSLFSGQQEEQLLPLKLQEATCSRPCSGWQRTHSPDPVLPRTEAFVPLLHYGIICVALCSLKERNLDLGGKSKTVGYLGYFPAPLRAATCKGSDHSLLSLPSHNL